MVPHLEPDNLEYEVEWALGGLKMNEASGGNGIAAELFKILKKKKKKKWCFKMLHSICQQIWKSQPQLQDWTRLVFISIPKKGNAKECIKP